MTNETLKNCPFCDNCGFVTSGIRGSEYIFYVRCGECEATGEKFASKFDTEAKNNAIKAWNHRTNLTECERCDRIEKWQNHAGEGYELPIIKRYKKKIEFVKSIYQRRFVNPITLDAWNKDIDRAKELLHEIGELE